MQTRRLGAELVEVVAQSSAAVAGWGGAQGFEGMGVDFGSFEGVGAGDVSKAHEGVDEGQLAQLPTIHETLQEVLLNDEVLAHPALGRT